MLFSGPNKPAWQEALLALKNLELHLRPCQRELEAGGARPRGQCSGFPQPHSQVLGCLQGSVELNPHWLRRASVGCFLGLVEVCRHGGRHPMPSQPSGRHSRQSRSPAQLRQCLLPFGTFCLPMKLTGQLCLLPLVTVPPRGLSRRPALLFIASNQRNDFQLQATYMLLLKRVYSS